MRLSNLTIFGLTASLCGLSAAQAAEADTARYRVTFERTWSSQTHPDDFPLLAHFSPLIGATHSSGYALFSTRASATPGLEKLCEEGRHQPLDEELRAAMTQGQVGAVIETDAPIRDVPASVVTEFEIDASHPMVSIAAMIAPSPDWCAVATGVELIENGRFVDQKTVALQAWDVGTDSATGYRARDADMQPRGPVQLSDSPYFRGAAASVGRVTFTRLD